MCVLSACRFFLSQVRLGWAGTLRSRREIFARQCSAVALLEYTNIALVLASRASRASRASQTFSIAFWKCLRPILALQIGTTPYEYLCNRFQALQKVLLRFLHCILTTKHSMFGGFFKFSDFYSSHIFLICKFY